MIQNDKANFWQKHYEIKHQQQDSDGLAKSLDYSNERVRLQTYAHVLEAAEDLTGKSVLDVGCGWGSLSLIFHACGTKNILGVDVVPDTIMALGDRYPFISWRFLDLMDERAVINLPRFDRIVAVESLQYVDFKMAVKSLWSHVEPSGRLIASVPNSSCPIVGKVSQREGSNWVPVSDKEIESLTHELPDVETLMMKGLTFREDQKLWPYSASDWNATLQGVPNRIVFVIIRSS